MRRWKSGRFWGDRTQRRTRQQWCPSADVNDAAYYIQKMKEKQTNETNGKKVNDCVTFMVLAIITKM